MKISLAILLYLLCFANARHSIATPHELRMERFIITRREFMKKTKTSVLRFLPSGTVTKEEIGSLVKGQWSLSPSTGRITFTLQEKGIFENYSAEFQLKAFADAPEMVKGIILMDNERFGIKNLFRRVTGTFNSVGTGLDTFDYSYNKRQ
mmetsp:Transcript_31635/g.30161  ORF Transcript_31635/g.30161 Transcript_31635/m.30161 type:complete len:150 (-) Transcript_31635:79-528(-)|eukprot:CAMPEP_0119039962 /NCGR_PEP_ID=MMETSP1177-20130426/9746_1 /TAXON_ID=2985 /ORGANISM="Ochromonas sp, Strain CCMP1899" /LENGTH=149 /DNA_ID=CAMNT_0007004529 /DNA_START=46 /DNA_END=495 /DNA_ORIENTATION=-